MNEEMISKLKEAISYAEGVQGRFSGLPLDFSCIYVSYLINDAKELLDDEEASTHEYTKMIKKLYELES